MFKLGEPLVKYEVILDDNALQKWVVDMLLCCREWLQSYNAYSSGYHFYFWKEKHNLLTESLQEVEKNSACLPWIGMTYAECPTVTLHIFRTEVLPALDIESLKDIKEAMAMHEFIRDKYRYMDGAGKCGYFLALVYLYYSVKTGQQLVEFSFLGGHEFPWRFHPPIVTGYCQYGRTNITSNYILPVGFNEVILSDKPVTMIDSAGQKSMVELPTVNKLLLYGEIQDHKLKCVGVNDYGEYYIYYREENALREKHYNPYIG